LAIGAVARLPDHVHVAGRRDRPGPHDDVSGHQRQLHQCHLWLLAVTGGAGAILVEVLADTGLQRCLDEEVLGRAYGFALPAAVSGIVVGSLVAAPLVAG
jgi:hypothetical protein